MQLYVQFLLFAGCTQHKIKSHWQLKRMTDSFRLSFPEAEIPALCSAIVSRWSRQGMEGGACAHAAFHDITNQLVN